MIDKETNRKKYTKEEYLPEKLVVKLMVNIFNNNKLEYRTKNNFLQCVAIVYFHQVKLGEGINNYIQICYDKLDKFNNAKLRLSLYGILGKIFKTVNVEA